MRGNNQFVYTLWAAAIVVCVLLSVFALIFSACSKQDAEGTDAPESGFSVVRESPESNT